MQFIKDGSPELVGDEWSLSSGRGFADYVGRTVKDRKLRKFQRRVLLEIFKFLIGLLCTGDVLKVD